MPVIDQLPRIPLDQQPPIANQPYSDSANLLEQVMKILAQPPMPISSRLLADAIELVKIQLRMDYEPPPSTPPPTDPDFTPPLVGVPNLTQAPVCLNPLIMPGGESINVTFDSAPTTRCSLAPPDSHYMAIGFSAGGDSHLNFVGFTHNGVHSYGFCLDHTKAAPVGPFDNISMEQAMPSTPQNIRLAVSFCIATAPADPADAAAGLEFFEFLGADSCPNLNGYDAYGVIQATIWCLLGFATPSSLTFTTDSNCPSPSATPKFPCLQAAVNTLYGLSLSYGNGNNVCSATGASGSSGSACGNCACAACGPNIGDGCNDPGGVRLGDQLGTVLCCNTGSAVTDQTSTYLVFVGCANDIRECCGRVVLGPFRLNSSNQGTPTISLIPCGGCIGPGITLVDACCNTFAEPPTIGQEFYITFRPPCCRFCFDLQAEMETTATAVYYFQETSNPALQPVGAPILVVQDDTAVIHICIDITPPQPPAPPQPPTPPTPPESLLITTNNNNNNNNSNSSNNNNSNIQSLLETVLLSNLVNSTGQLQNGQGAFPPQPNPYVNPCPPGTVPCYDPYFPPGYPPYPGQFPGVPPGCGQPPFVPGMGTGPPYASCCRPCCCPAPQYPPPCCPMPPPCVEPCFIPPQQQMLPEPPVNLIIQPASLTYQAMPLPVPCISPPPYPYLPMQEAYPPPFRPEPYMPPPYPMPYPQPYPPPYPQGPSDETQHTQQVYSPVTVVVPPSEQARDSCNYPPPAQPFIPPPPVPPYPLLPEISGAPHPDFSQFQPQADNDSFFRGWYNQ